MRKIFKVILTLSSTLIITAGVLGAIFGVASIKNNKNLVFGNFGEYENPSLETSIASDIQNEFKGFSVGYTYYNLNNQLPAMYANNQISIGVPTDYEAAELISMGLIKPLDYSLFNENKYGMHLGYYLNGNFVKIENGILPIQVNLAQENTTYHVPYTLDGDGNEMSLQEQYATEYKYSICNLLSPDIICDMTQIYLHCDFNNTRYINVLDYDLPYFFQNYTFAYFTPSQNSNSYKQNEKIYQTLSNEASWSTILESIQNDSWFHSVNNKPKIGMVASPQSVYSVAASIQNADATPEGEAPITNPTNNNSSISQMQTTFSYFTSNLSSKYLGTNPMYRSDSSAGIINELDNGQLNGGFCYNGDALYTAMGGNFANSLTNEQWERLTPQNFHVVQPKYTMIALDTVGINSSLPSTLLLPAYKFMYDLCLEGCDAAPTYDGYSMTKSLDSYDYLLQKYKNDKTLINLITGNTNSKYLSCPFYYWSTAMNQNNSNNPWNPNEDTPTTFVGANTQTTSGSTTTVNYTYGPMSNFQFNLYVSPWLNINDFISQDMSANGANNQNGSVGENWLTAQTSYSFPANTTQATYDEYNNWFESIYTINPTNYTYNITTELNFYTCVELPLTPYQVSNQQFAFTSSMRENF